MHSKTGQEKRFLLVCTLHIFILFNLVVSQPLLEKLTENPEFLVAHAATRVDILALVAILCFLLPSLLMLIEATAGFFGNTAVRLVHSLFVICLFITLSLLLIRQFKILQGAAAILVAILSGGLLTVVYRAPIVRSSLTYLSPVILVIPLLFLSHGSIRKLISTNQVEINPASQTANSPVVMVIFDELPVTSLMNEDRLMDGVLFPNFAGLLKDFTWFRNTTTVSGVTQFAVPAILTGKYPNRKLLPTLSDHPENIFTLFGGSHELRVMEAVTSLCPPQLNVLSRSTSANTFSRVRLLLMDLSAVYLQMIVPSPYSLQFPDVTITWGDFWDPPDATNDKDNRRARAPSQRFKTFVQSLQPSEKPFFSYLHISLPHRPWKYLPDGKEYEDFNEGRKGDKFWQTDDWAATVAFQRHLLQVSYADRLLGELIQHLRKTGLYDRSLIVVLADHGISLWPGQETRKATTTTYQDILFVPFLVKAPFQKRGAIMDRKLETIDILPTLVKMLGIRTSWKFDGIPAMDTHVSERPNRKIILHDRVDRLVHDIHDENRTLQRKVSLFGKVTGISGLFNIGPHPELLNREVRELPVSSSSELIVKLRGKEEFENVDLSSYRIPAYIAGEVEFREDQDELVLAIALNGKIRTVTKAFRSGDRFRFGAVIPPSALSNGKNKIDVLLVSGNKHEMLMASLQ